MRNILVGLLMWACCGASYAQEWRLLQLDEMSMEYAEIKNNRDVYFPYADQPSEHEYWLYRVAAKFDLALVKWGKYGLRWRNAVIGDSTNVQFRQVQWDFRWGLQLGNSIEVFYDHRSRHGMEMEPECNRCYPLENRLGVEVFFYRRKS